MRYMHVRTLKLSEAKLGIYFVDNRFGAALAKQNEMVRLGTYSKHGPDIVQALQALQAHPINAVILR